MTLRIQNFKEHSLINFIKEFKEFIEDAMKWLSKPKEKELKQNKCLTVVQEGNKQNSDGREKGSPGLENGTRNTEENSSGNEDSQSRNHEGNKKLPGNK